MKRLVLFVFAWVAATGCGSGDQKEESIATETEGNKMAGFYIGTYTTGESEGIYHARFDPATGALSGLKLSARAENPSYLALDASSHRLYAVNEMVAGSDIGKVSAYSAGEQNDLTLLGTASSGGAYPCYVSLTQGGEELLVANYGGGNVALLKIQPGETRPLTEGSLLAHHGTGPNTARQEAPHAHYIRQISGTDYALAADLGTDKIYRYRVGPEGLELLDSIIMEPGSGPRHIDFHPQLPVMYVINELNSTITVFSYNLENDTFKEMQVISTLPGGYDDESFCAGIHVHPGGQLLFGSNRGHDSIVSYRIDDMGMLELTGHFTEGVVWPRNFAIGPGGDYLVIGNERGNTIITARINKGSGTLESTGHSMEVPAPVCILFE